MRIKRRMLYKLCVSFFCCIFIISTSSKKMTFKNNCLSGKIKVDFIFFMFAGCQKTRSVGINRVKTLLLQRCQQLGLNQSTLDNQPASLCLCSLQLHYLFSFFTFLSVSLSVNAFTCTLTTSALT